MLVLRRRSWLLMSLLAAAACSQDFSVFRFDRDDRDRARTPDAGPSDAAASSGDSARPEPPLPAAGADAGDAPDAGPAPAADSGKDDAATSASGTGAGPEGGAGGAPGTSGAGGAPGTSGAGAGAAGGGGDGRGGTGGTPGSGEAGDAAVEPPDAGLDPADASDFEPPDAGPDAFDASLPPAAAPPRSDGGSASAGPAVATPDAGPGARSASTPPLEDAGDPRLALCRAGWAELGDGGACRDCACDVCADPILDCLVQGDETERQRCSEVLACALRNHCQDYACYCSTTGCGRPGSVGDGPCVAAVHAAAGGTRTRVNALRSASPLDLNEPLNRASQAIACIYGVHPASPGPTLAGRCSSGCD